MIARHAVFALLATLISCSKECGTNEAMRTFAAFQAALQQSDQDACRELLTTDSQAALANLPWAEIAKKKPLKVLGAQRQHPDAPVFLVDVSDPNNDDARSQFVVVREYGRLVVDLVASAGLTAKVVPASGREEQFEPAALTPKDHERIRQYQLSQPPR
jgi:hypothetical protein